jgi:hypothetical protein
LDEVRTSAQWQTDRFPARRQLHEKVIPESNSSLSGENAKLWSVALELLLGNS